MTSLSYQQFSFRNVGPSHPPTKLWTQPQFVNSPEALSLQLYRHHPPTELYGFLSNIVSTVSSAATSAYKAVTSWFGVDYNEPPRVDVRGNFNSAQCASKFKTSSCNVGDTHSCFNMNVEQCALSGKCRLMRSDPPSGSAWDLCSKKGCVPKADNNLKEENCGSAGVGPIPPSKFFANCYANVGPSSGRHKGKPMQVRHLTKRRLELFN